MRLCWCLFALPDLKYAPSLTNQLSSTEFFLLVHVTESEQDEDEDDEGEDDSSGEQQQQQPSPTIDWERAVQTLVELNAFEATRASKRKKVEKKVGVAAMTVGHVIAADSKADNGRARSVCLLLLLLLLRSIFELCSSTSVWCPWLTSPQLPIGASPITATPTMASRLFTMPQPFVSLPAPSRT